MMRGLSYAALLFDGGSGEGQSSGAFPPRSYCLFRKGHEIHRPNVVKTHLSRLCALEWTLPDGLAPAPACRPDCYHDNRRWTRRRQAGPVKGSHTWESCVFVQTGVWVRGAHAVCKRCPLVRVPSEWKPGHRGVKGRSEESRRRGGSGSQWRGGQGEDGRPPLSLVSLSDDWDWASVHLPLMRSSSDSTVSPYPLLKHKPKGCYLFKKTTTKRTHHSQKKKKGTHNCLVCLRLLWAIYSRSEVMWRDET